MGDSFEHHIPRLPCSLLPSGWKVIELWAELSSKLFGGFSVVENTVRFAVLHLGKDARSINYAKGEITRVFKDLVCVSLCG